VLVGQEVADPDSKRDPPDQHQVTSPAPKEGLPANGFET
jgi:hypothetical protein